MKKYKRNFGIFITWLVILVLSIVINFYTINSAKERIIDKINNTPITELLEKNKTQTNIEENIEGEPIENKKQDETNSYNTKELIIIIISSSIGAISLLTIIVTNRGKISLFEYLSTSKRLIYFSICLVLMCSILPTILIINSDKKILNGSDTKGRNEKSIAVIEITKDQKYSSLTKESDKKDTSVIQVKNQSNFTASNLNLTKSAGDSSDKDSSLYYGLNSAFIVKDSSKTIIKNSTITTGTNYSTAFFSSGDNSISELNDVKIKTTGNNSNGITLSETSEINANNINIITTGKNSHAINTMCEGSYITVNNAQINTNDINSAIFSSKGKIEAVNVDGNSEKSYIGIIEGKNSIYISNSKLNTKAHGLNEEEKLSAAFFIYSKNQKNSSADFGNASLNLENSKISIDKKSSVSKTAPLFYITNTTAVINITNTTLNYESKILLKAEKNDLFGEKDNNGSDITFTATDQFLKGNIIVDEFSKVRLHLNSSTFKGHLNSENKSKNVDVTFDKKSYWILTGDSYINTLTIQNGKISRLRTNIRSNGYNIYYNAKNNEWLNGRTIRLSGGGKMIPIFES